MQEKVTFESAGQRMAGVLHLPRNYKHGERRPAIIVLHGFGSNKDAANVTTPTSMYADWGYVVFRFDRRGCGESGGEPGLNLCPEHVEDTQAALSWLAVRPEVRADRIALQGTSFGGAIAIYTGGVDSRAAACPHSCRSRRAVSMTPRFSTFLSISNSSGASISMMGREPICGKISASSRARSSIE
jgi:uncharacterized protein